MRRTRVPPQPPPPAGLLTLLAKAREQAAAVVSLAGSGADITAPLKDLHDTVEGCGRLLGSADVVTIEDARRLLGETLNDILSAEGHAAARLSELSARIDDAALAHRRNRAYRSAGPR